jgi:hypothetical protein
MALHIGHLGDHEAGAGIGQHAEMGEVPVGGDAVAGTVLAHRRDHDPIGKLKLSQPDRREQCTGHDWQSRSRSGACASALHFDKS